MSDDDFEDLAKKHNGLCLFLQILTIGAFTLASLYILYMNLMIMNQPMHALAYILLGLIVTAVVSFILQRLKYKME